MAIVNITVSNDADFYREFQYATADEPPVPINITGGTMEMMLRRDADDETALIRFATDTGEIVITNAALGKFTLLISHVVLQQLDIGSYEQSNIMTKGGLKTEIWSGTLINNAGPTR